MSEKHFIYNGYNIRVTKTKRKSLSLEVDRDLNVTIRAPRFCPDSDIYDFLTDHEDWIEKAVAKIEAKRAKAEEMKNVLPKLSELEIEELRKSAQTVFERRVAYYAPLVGVNYGRVTVRIQKTKWGSCSGKGNLNFNLALMRAPIEILDYVVVHELCHILEMNHSPAFWAHVENILPDYKSRRKWLKDNGAMLSL